MSDKEDDDVADDNERIDLPEGFATKLWVWTCPNKSCRFRVTTRSKATCDIAVAEHMIYVHLE